MPRSLHTRLIAPVSVAIGIVLVAGISTVSASTGSPTYYACADKHGTLSLLARGHCKSGTHKVTVGLRGLTGSAGPAGAAGASGTPGAPGKPGQDGEPGVIFGEDDTAYLDTPFDGTAGGGTLHLTTGFAYFVSGHVEFAQDPTNSVKATSVSCHIAANSATVRPQLAGGAVLPPDGSPTVVPILGYVDATDAPGDTYFVSVTCSPQGPAGATVQYRGVELQGLPLDVAFSQVAARPDSTRTVTRSRH